MFLFQRPFHYSFLQWTYNHHMVKNHGKVVNCTHKIIWIHVTLWIWWNEARFVACEWVNELKVHFTKVFGKTLHGFVFNKHLLILFVMTHTTHIIVDLLVLSIRRPPFVFASWFIVVMLKITIGNDKFYDAFPFCYWCFHVILKINNIQIGFGFNFLFINICHDFKIFLVDLFRFLCFNF